MPKVVSYTPSFLSEGTPGHALFQPAPTNGSSFTSSNGFYSSNKRATKPGPRRTIARRGTEIFIAVGKEIRWADLVYLQEKHSEKKAAREHGRSRRRDSNGSANGDSFAQGYRVGCEYYLLRQMLTISDHKNASRGGYSTTRYITTLELHRHIDNPYRSHWASAGTLTAHGSRFESPQDEDIHPWSYNTCHIPGCNCFCSLAPLGRERNVFGHRDGRCHSASMGALYSGSMVIR